MTTPNTSLFTQNSATHTLAGIDVSHHDITTLIPHRAPFLFIDHTLRYVPHISLETCKNILHEAPYFAGHFPDFPILPGVLITEALAQSCAAFLALEAHYYPEQFEEIAQENKVDAVTVENDPYVYVLVRTETRNIRPVFPDTVLYMHVEQKDVKAHFFDFDVRAYQDDGKTCVRGKLTVGRSLRSRLIPPSGQETKTGQPH